MSKLVVIRKVNRVEDVFTDSKIIADGTGNEHRAVRQLIRKYEDSIRQFGNLDISNVGVNGTNSYETIYNLNEMQATFLITLMKNNDKVVKFKIDLVKQFYAMRSALIEKQSSDWKETRIKGKLARKDETDIIMNKLIPLAIEQGSKNSGKLYMSYSKLVNECVGIPPKSRDKVTQRILDIVFNLENLIENVISEEVDKGTYYKDIYQICKGKCKLLSELSYVPAVKMLGM